ncbi:hypothetical protein HK405_007228, partial [Cladochytrium tenue]
ADAAGEPGVSERLAPDAASPRSDAGVARSGKLLDDWLRRKATPTETAPVASRQETTDLPPAVSHRPHTEEALDTILAARADSADAQTRLSAKATAPIGSPGSHTADDAISPLAESCVQISTDTDLATALEPAAMEEGGIPTDSNPILGENAADRADALVTPRPASKRQRATDTPPQPTLESVTQRHPVNAAIEAILAERLAPMQARIDELATLAADNATLRQSLTRAELRIAELEARLSTRGRSNGRRSTSGAERGPGAARTSPVRRPTFAQAAANGAQIRPPTIASARTQAILSNTAPLHEFFRLPGREGCERPPRADDDRLAPLYIRTSFSSAVRSTPLGLGNR